MFLLIFYAYQTHTQRVKGTVQFGYLDSLAGSTGGNLGSVVGETG